VNYGNHLQIQIEVVSVVAMGQIPIKAIGRIH